MDALVASMDYAIRPGEDASTERNDPECAMSSPVQVSYDCSYSVSKGYTKSLTLRQRVNNNIIEVDIT